MNIDVNRWGDRSKIKINFCTIISENISGCKSLVFAKTISHKGIEIEATIKFLSLKPVPSEIKINTALLIVSSYNFQTSFHIKIVCCVTS